MGKSGWRIAMIVPWLGLVAMLADIWHVYGRLPAVMASHFNIAGLPNGWAPKQQLFSLIVPIVFVMLCFFTFLLSRFPRISGLGWLLLVADYWSIGFMLGLVHAILRVGLGEAKTLEFPAGGWSLLMGAVLVIGEIGRIRAIRKRANADHGTFVAEERHGSALMASVLAAISVVIVLIASVLPTPNTARVVAVTVSAILLGCAIWAFTGFVYRITTAGLEIRMLGVPIRFISAKEVDSYGVEGCNPLTDFGGWGIRGIGHMRAYIWGGNRCVHLRTFGGDEIYLGIDDPDRMARELEAVLPILRRS